MPYRCPRLFPQTVARLPSRGAHTVAHVLCLSKSVGRVTQNMSKRHVKRRTGNAACLRIAEDLQRIKKKILTIAFKLGCNTFPTML